MSSIASTAPAAPVPAPKATPASASPSAKASWTPTAAGSTSPAPPAAAPSSPSAAPPHPAPDDPPCVWMRLKPHPNPRTRSSVAHDPLPPTRLYAPSVFLHKADLAHKHKMNARSLSRAAQRSGFGHFSVRRSAARGWPSFRVPHKADLGRKPGIMHPAPRRIKPTSRISRPAPPPSLSPSAPSP